MPAVSLPDRMVKAITRAVGDFPLKTIIDSGHKLNSYIRCRKPPIEEKNVKQQVHDLEEMIDADPERFKLPTMVPDADDDHAVKIYMERRQQKIKSLLKTRNYAWRPIQFDEHESLLYLLGRAPQEYAVLLKIFKEIEKRDPTFKPQSFFDFGAGVGTGTWAVSELWKKHIYEYYLVDASKHMNDLSDLLLRDGDPNKQMFLRNVNHRQFLPARETKFDIVLSAFSMFEMPSLKNRLEVAQNLWNKTSGYLIFVEVGTNAGFKLLNEIREYLMHVKQHNAEEAYVFSPCPHDLNCPRYQLNDGTPCNFEASYNTLPFSGPVTIHKELYSYFVIKKGPSTCSADQWPRIIRPTLVRSKHTVCRMCTKEGKLQEIIFTQSKHGKWCHRTARHSQWGDQYPVESMTLPEKEIVEE